MENSYFYVRNAQGDIIGLIDKAGTQVVSYTYDSWGKLISIKDKDNKDITNNTTHVGYKNPYRYRGYRYDTETGLYYLQSRYYNPEWGRFINADGITGFKGELLSHNMFAYCSNDPINMKDDTGFVRSQVQEDSGSGGGSYSSSSGSQSGGGSISSNPSVVGRFKETISYGANRLRNGLSAINKSANGLEKISNLNTTHKITMGKNKFNKFVETIKKEGIKEPIKYVEYNGKKYVVDGHHRLQAAKRLRIEDVPVEEVELPYAGYKTIEDLLWSD